MKRIHPELVSPVSLLIIGVCLVTFFSIYADPHLRALVIPPPHSRDFAARLAAGPMTAERARAAGEALEGMNEYATALASCVGLLSHVIKVLCLFMVVIAGYD